MKRLCLIAVPLLLLGCGGSSSSPSVQPRASFVYGIDINSIATNLKTLNGGTNVAGWNQLTGTATVNGETVKVEFQVDLSYTNGSGAFGGFYTMTFPDSSIVTLMADGTAQKQADSSTIFNCQLKVLGGTGTYANVKGSGHFTGSRAGVLGAPVHLEVTANII